MNFSNDQLKHYFYFCGSHYHQQRSEDSFWESFAYSDVKQNGFFFWCPTHIWNVCFSEFVCVCDCDQSISAAAKTRKQWRHFSTIREMEKHILWSSELSKSKKSVAWAPVDDDQGGDDVTGGQSSPDVDIAIQQTLHLSHACYIGDSKDAQVVSVKYKTSKNKSPTTQVSSKPLQTFSPPPLTHSYRINRSRPRLEAAALGLEISSLKAIAYHNPSKCSEI